MSRSIDDEMKQEMSLPVLSPSLSLKQITFNIEIIFLLSLNAIFQIIFFIKVVHLTKITEMVSKTNY